MNNRARRMRRTGRSLCALAAACGFAVLGGPALGQAHDQTSPAQAATFDAARGIHTSDAGLAARLEALVRSLETKRQEQHIPGLAIAVVKGDEVVLARGLGVKSIETGEPVDEHTLFAIGSQTKSFTTMVLSMLGDEGKLSWDDPVRKHVPGFKLFDAEANEKVLLRDLCSHRTGLPRTDLLWASGKASKQEMMERLAFAEPTAKFRERWQYNNSMFMVAGMAAESAGGMPWDRLIATRIFGPLGITESNTSVAKMDHNPAACLGYSWDADKKENKRLPMRVITCDAAGAINSSATDMSKWVRLHLGNGAFEGKRLVSEQMHAEMWKAHIPMGPGASYGLGWMLGEWNGKRVVQHGGNIDGFFTACGMLPDDGVGFVLMGSLTYSGLQGECLPMVWETFFPPAPASADGVLTEAQLQEYAGKYHAEFLHVDATANIKDGKLHLDIPGQLNFELKWPDAEGKWAFAMAPDQIKVRFNRDEQKRIVSSTVFQGGAELEMPRLGEDGNPVVAEGPAPLERAQLQEFTGTYHFGPSNLDWKIVITSSGKLAVDVPKQRVFDLKWPDKDGRWKVAILPASCTFNRDGSGKVVSMTWSQGGDVQLPRTGGGDADVSLPTLDEIAALRKASADPDKVRAMGDIEVSGRARVVNQGVEGTVHGLANADGRILQDIEFGKFGAIRASFNGEKGWSESVGEAYTELQGDRLAELKKSGSQFVVSDLKESFDTVTVVGRETLDGKEVIVVKGTTAKPDKIVRQFLDAHTGLPLKEETSVLIPGLGRLPMTVTYDDYREFEGVLFPMKVRLTSEENGAMEFVLESVTPRAKLSPGAYDLKPAG